jgi:hypothetical protein
MPHCAAQTHIRRNTLRYSALRGLAFHQQGLEFCLDPGHVDAEKSTVEVDSIGGQTMKLFCSSGYSL